MDKVDNKIATRDDNKIATRDDTDQLSCQLLSDSSHSDLDVSYPKIKPKTRNIVNKQSGTYKLQNNYFVGNKDKNRTTNNSNRTANNNRSSNNSRTRDCCVQKVQKDNFIHGRDKNQISKIKFQNRKMEQEIETLKN